MSTPTTPDRPEDLDDPTGVRALLAGLPDPGPMPTHLVDRINASIAAEHEARAGTRVVSLAERRRPWRRVGLVAAAVAVAAVAVPALVVGTGSGGVLASLSGSRQSSASAAAVSAQADNGSAQSRAEGSTGPGQAGAGATPGATDSRDGVTNGGNPAGGKRVSAIPGGGAMSIYQSNTAYTSVGFTRQVRAFVDHPGSTLQPFAAESPTVGPVGTPIGLQPCLDALHLPPDAQVLADLATFDGVPAVVVVASTGTGQNAFALRRTCTSGQTTPLAGPVGLP